MGSLLEAFKYMMNGAKVPNWAKLVMGLCILMAIYIGQFSAVGQLADVQRESTERQIIEMRRMLYLLRNDNVDIRDDIREVAERDSLRARRIERKVDKASAKIDDINENGTDRSNERIDELIRMLKKGKR